MSGTVSCADIYLTLENNNIFSTIIELTKQHVALRTDRLLTSGKYSDTYEELNVVT